MLKLIYHTAVFGPIELEYDKPTVRVGSSEDNDLVLRHPSIGPHHCLLAFRDEKVVCLPPDANPSAQTASQGLTGQEYGAGDRIKLGDLEFSLAHSARTVAIPEAWWHDLAEPEPAAGPAAEPPEEQPPREYYCPNCQAVFRESELKRVGLVGHAKRCLCPKCSQMLDSEPEPQQPSTVRKKWWRQTSGSSKRE